MLYQKKKRSSIVYHHLSSNHAMTKHNTSIQAKSNQIKYRNPRPTAPGTSSPRSSFLFSRTRTKRRIVAATMAMKAVTQLTVIAITVFWGGALISI